MTQGPTNQYVTILQRKFSFSLQVILRCGSANDLVQVSEPSRCEYRMEFKTPAACQDIDLEGAHLHEHGGEL